MNQATPPDLPTEPVLAEADVAEPRRAPWRMRLLAASLPLVLLLVL